jgi:hypothetical protein
MKTLTSIRAGSPFQCEPIDFVGPLAATALETVNIQAKEIFLANIKYRKSYAQTEKTGLLRTYFTPSLKSRESRIDNAQTYAREKSHLPLKDSAGNTIKTQKT